MTDDLSKPNYNYDIFKRENFEPIMKWDESPPPGSVAPDFPAWRLEDQSQVMLSELWSENRFLVVEFGSFT